MYAITGATGNTGKLIAERLLAAGQKVRVIGRNARRLAPFTTREGAEAYVADTTDPAALARAFSGARAAYLLIPPNPSATDLPAYGERAAAALAQAVAESDVGHVVMLSSIGAEKSEKTGPILALHQLEQRLSVIAGLGALFLRADYFMENLLHQVPVIKSMGLMGDALRGDLALGMVATTDIAAAASEALLRLDFEGKASRELQGPRDVTLREAAALIGSAIGKPDLSYRQVPGWQLRPVLIGMGMSASMANALMELAEALNSGHVRALEPRTALNTGSTTLEAFVAEAIVPAYRGQAAGA